MRKYFILGSCIVFSLLVMGGLFFSSSHQSDHKNGFQRLFSLYPLKVYKELDLGYNSYYIAGLANERMYLGNTTAPFHMLSCTYELTDTLHLRNTIYRDTTVNWRAIKVEVDSPRVYLTEVVTPSFLSTNISFDRVHKHELAVMKCNLAYPLTPNTMVVRYYDYKTKRGVLQKVSWSPGLRKGKLYELPQQHGSTFSFDGFVCYNKKYNLIFYTYYYRNRFVCLDTNMNFLYEGKTIDTNNVAKIKSVEIRSARKIEKLMSSPPLTVNKRSCTDGGLLYNCSALASDRESKDALEQYSVVDIYDINKKGAYHHSIKIPKQYGKRMRAFAVRGHLFIALYDRYLITYKL